MIRRRYIIVIIMLIFLGMGIIPPSAAATSPVNYSGNITSKGTKFSVDATFSLSISCSDNWRYWPGLTTDTLTASIINDKVELNAKDKDISFDDVIGTSYAKEFQKKEWETSEYDWYYGWENHTWTKYTYVSIDGEAWGSILYSGDITSVSPTTLSWTSSSSDSATIQTTAAPLGSATIKARIDGYKLRVKVSTKTYKDGSLDSQDEGSWSDWATIGSTPSDYAPITMTNMGVALFVVIVVIIVAALLIFLFFTKRQVEIVAPEEDEVSPILKEVGPPPEEVGPPLEEVGPPPEVEETEEKYCLACGSTNPHGAQYCKNCGTTLN